MPRIGSSPLAFPDFRGATRRLILINLAAYFALLLASLAFSRCGAGCRAVDLRSVTRFLHGSLWQPLTYSFVHPGLLGTLFELLSLWFLAGFLEGFHNSNWVTSLYAVSVLGTAAAALALYVVAGTLAPSLLGNPTPLYGCFGGIFGLLAAIGLLYGDMQFLLFPLPIGIKARYLVVDLRAHRGRHALWPAAAVRLCATGRGAGRPALRALAPRRGASFAFSESWYGLRNRYYRWKRRRAARKFEVYMRPQGRTVKFDGQGRRIDEDADDKKRWN